MKDGMVQNTLQLRKDIVRAIRKHKPNAVITQNPTARWSGNYVNHPDHRNTGDATMDAVFPSARDVHMFPDLLAKEGLGPHIVEHLYLGDGSKDADIVFDITETMNTKVRALKAHVSQVSDPDSIAVHLRDNARVIGDRVGLGFGESFKYFYLGRG